MSFEVGTSQIGEDESTFIIAEAGSNHNGNRAMAFDLVDAAAEAGADAIKFQTFKADKMYPEDSGGIGTADSDAYSLLKSLEMPYNWIPDLASYAKDQGLYYLSSPFDRESADILEEYVPAYKIASTLLSHHPFLEYLAEKGKPLIVSTGAHSMKDIEQTMAALDGLDVDIALLQCTSAYPTPINKTNVSVIESLQERFEVPIGLSDHTEHPTIAPTAAASLGGAVIEKHITLDKSLEGPDHSFALEPEELAQMVSYVRSTEAALGDGQKEVLDIEQETYENGRRCLHAARPLSEGESLSEADIQWLRPGENPRGVPPSEKQTILGQRVVRDISRGEPISREDLTE
jgi:N,N'-diacetyllegionaminate synthase